MWQNMVNYGGGCRTHWGGQEQPPLFVNLSYGYVLLQFGARKRTILRRDYRREPRTGLCVGMTSGWRFLVKGYPQWQQDDRPTERRQADDADHRRTSRKRSFTVWLGLERRTGIPSAVSSKH